LGELPPFILDRKKWAELPPFELNAINAIVQEMMSLRERVNTLESLVLGSFVGAAGSGLVRPGEISELSGMAADLRMQKKRPPTVKGPVHEIPR
jgi:hypothetical protein